MTLVRLLRRFSSLLVYTQVLSLVLGVIITIPILIKFQHEDKDLDNYCDYDMVLFSCVYFGIALFFLVFGGTIALVGSYLQPIFEAEMFAIAED